MLGLVTCFLFLELILHRVLSLNCNRLNVSVFQNGLLLGNFEAIEGTASLTTFYGWTSGTKSFNGILPYGAYKSLIFVYRDTTTCLKSIGVVHSMRGVGSGTAQLQLESNDFDVSIFGDPTVQDDPQRSSIDEYIYSSSPVPKIVMTWVWDVADTDGFGQELWRTGCVDITPLRFQGINQWQFVSKQYSQTSLNMNSPVRICFDEGDDPAAVDSDFDGVCNPGVVSSLCAGSDNCPGTPLGEPVDSSGCSQLQVDQDADGVCDPGKISNRWCTGWDLCPNTPPNQVVDSSGCPAGAAEDDSDGDGVCDPGVFNSAICTGQDRCPNTPSGQPVDSNGCSRAQADQDLDGVCNPGVTSNRWCTGRDLCPNTPSGRQVDANGCSRAQVDQDRDGVCDPNKTSNRWCTGWDLCPNTPRGQAVDSSGCPAQVPEDDSDGDGICNPGVFNSAICTGQDRCPNTPSGQPVDSNGCSRAQVDQDLDGVCNPGVTSTWCRGSDNCPNTPQGTPVDANGCPQASPPQPSPSCPKCPISVFETLPPGCSTCVP